MASLSFFRLEKGKGGDTLSLGGLEGVGQEEKRKKDITDSYNIMSKTCPDAFGKLKIVPADKSRGCGRLCLERRVWVWTLTSLLCHLREFGLHPEEPNGLI